MYFIFFTDSHINIRHGFLLLTLKDPSFFAQLNTTGGEGGGGGGCVLK